MSVPAFLRRIFRGGGAEGGVRELVQLCDALLAESGEYASTALAREALAKWQGLDEPSREEFFDLLVRSYSPAVEPLNAKGQTYCRCIREVPNDPKTIWVSAGPNFQSELGVLFRSRTNLNNNAELLIFVTPKILPD